MKRTPLKQNPEKVKAWKERCRKKWFERQRTHEAKFTKQKPRKELKPQSDKRAKETRKYYRIRNEWLQKPQNAACGICLVLDQRPAPATEVHHSRGRNGRLLCDTRFYIPSCRGCRLVPHERPEWAREMGILASASEWGVYPEPE